MPEINEPLSLGLVARRLWQKPAIARDRRRQSRHIEFLELFFDLVFVVFVAQLAHGLAAHLSAESVIWFIALFFMAWTSWLNGTVYHDYHGTRDVSIRVFTFAQMLAVAAMTVFVGHVPGEGTSGFALAYAANSAILAIMWFRTGLHDPQHRIYSNPYSAAYAIGAVLFGLSTLLTGLTYWLWAAGVLVQLAALWPSIRHQDEERDGPPVTASLIERMGLLVIIVLGEVVNGAIYGMTAHETIDAGVLVVGFLGILIAIGLWWLHFDLMSDRGPRSGLRYPWMLLHFPLVAGIAAVGAGVLVMIGHDHHLSEAGRWLISASVAVALLANLALGLTLRIEDGYRVFFNIALTALGLGAAIALAVGMTGLDAAGTLIALAAILTVLVVLGLAVWFKTVFPNVGA